MAAYYIDSSALVKRYVAETGSTWMIGLTDPAAGHDLYTVTLTGPELISAMTRRARGGHLAPPLSAQALARFKQDWQLQYQLIEPDASVISRAMSIAEVHGLRGYDAVHVAAALELLVQRPSGQLPPLTFVSADQDQLAVAGGVELPIENPNQHC